MVIFSFLFVIIWLELLVFIFSLSFSISLTLSYFWFYFFFLFPSLRWLYHITLLSTVTVVMWPLMTRKLCERRWHRQRLRLRQRQRYHFFLLLSLGLHLCTLAHFMQATAIIEFFSLLFSICSFTVFFLSISFPCISLLIFSTKVMTSKSITVFFVYILYDISWELTFPLKFKRI